MVYECDMVHTSSSFLATAVNLDQPGRYLHWSIFTVSVANLVLIAVMVVIFGLALTIPFPGRRHGIRPPGGSGQARGAEDGGGPPPDDDTAAMWTSRVRRRALATLPPKKLLPDSQPAYVASWVYVFGVATLAALGLAIVSGMVIALGGTDWWHTDPVGHFFNSLHLWSVELFMAFMVIHLWGKFWMAAWRGRRALTWITGVVAFVASVVECFTGYLSQQNFDSQWISTNGKDAVNATGLGAFFNLLNFGQMLLWHVVLIPIILVALVGAHVLMVRVRGVSHPLPVPRTRGRAARRAAATADAAEWTGPTRRYDILKEATMASVVALVLVVLLASLLSSPDAPPVTVASWARVAPADFMATAASELAGTSETARYGPPYNHGTDNVQRVGVSWQLLAGVREPINAAETFVLSPLSKLSPSDAPLRRALSRYRAAPAGQQNAWANAYLKAVDAVTFHGNVPSVPASHDGPVPVMVASELTLARSGALDADLLAQHPFYGTNFTKPLLFLEDGNYFSSLATAQHLTGTQWGVMNETGSYPGQPWLWLYTLWYQVPGFKTSANVDLIAIYLTGVATLLLLAVPFIPGLRDIPRLVPVHRLIWRDWNRSQGGSSGGGGPGGTDAQAGVDT
ncbi:MAG: cytochrome b N-terminal domain-containing protein [Acidimicrobiales bacterium]